MEITATDLEVLEQAAYLDGAAVERWTRTLGVPAVQRMEDLGWVVRDERWTGCLRLTRLARAITRLDPTFCDPDPDAANRLARAASQLDRKCQADFASSDRRAESPAYRAALLASRRRVRVQIEYTMGPGDRPTAWGWLTVDGELPPADRVERRAWARARVGRRLSVPAETVALLAVHVGDDGELAEQTWHRDA